LVPCLAGELKSETFFLIEYTQVKKIEDSIAFVKAMPKPLAIYAFTQDAALRRRIVDETSSGCVTFNDAVVQVLPPTRRSCSVGRNLSRSYGCSSGG